jgi:uncharacterized protein YjgD (DUF1641 family)
MVTTIDQAAEPGAVQQTDLAQVINSLSRPEVLQSLQMLIEHLPQLTEMAVKLSEAYTLIRNVATDPVFVADLKGGFDEVVTPVKNKVKEIAEVVIEANDRANEHTETIGMLGLIKMLKDPQAQKLFRFTKALLETLNDKEQGRVQY